MAFKILHGDASPLQADFLTYINAPCNLREPMSHQHMFYTQSYGFNSLRVGGASLWNKLPLNIKCCDNICNLKKSLKQEVKIANVAHVLNVLCNFNFSFHLYISSLLFFFYCLCFMLSLYTDVK